MTPPPDTDWRHLLTTPERAIMLDDIARIALTLGQQLFPTPLGNDLDVEAHSLSKGQCPAERLGFITRLLPEITRTVHQIAEMPLSQAAREIRRVAPPARARQVTAADVLAAVRRGHTDRFLEEQVAARSLDTPENRAVAAFLAVLARDASAISAIAEGLDDVDNAQAARATAARLRGLRALPLWDSVADDRTAWQAPPTHRMLADARYASLAQAMRHYRQAFQFGWDSPLFSLPARETWRIYEAWGLFQTLDALRTLGFMPSLPGQSPRELISVSQDRLALSLTKGTESRISLMGPNGRQLSVFYNRIYPQQTYSLSHTMQPDIVIEDASGTTWVLDPKFKSYAEPGMEGDDINQMHAYRDAIVGLEGNRIITRAWCLFCGGLDCISRPMISYGSPGIVGALRLRPGNAEDFKRLRALLFEWLE